MAKNKYYYAKANVFTLDGVTYFTYNVYERRYLVFWFPVFECDSTDKEECERRCQQYIDNIYRDKMLFEFNEDELVYEGN